MRLLVLTDHAGHSASNSLYALVRALVADPRIAEVRVASRGTPANARFFAAEDARSSLSAARAAEDFAYSRDGLAFAPQRLAETRTTWADAVLLRIPHPVPVDWFAYLREAFGDLPIVNRPEGIAATTSKAWLLELPELCAPMALCRTPAEVVAFAKTRDAVLKPLEGYGGRGILRVRAGEVELDTVRVPLEAWPAHPLARHAYLAVEYLPGVREGDKRIVVCGGEVLGAVNRVPAAGKWLANVAQGGHAELSTLTPAERHIVDVLEPRLSPLGVVMYGVDTLVGLDGERVLSEVNTMSIGGLLDLPPGPDGRSAAERAAGHLFDALTAS